MKLAILIVIFAALGGWYCYDKYGAELFPASEESAYVDPRLEALEKRAKELFPTRENWARARHTYLAAGHTHRPSLTFSEKEGWGYFNTGSCVHPNTITCMELIYGQLSLVKWTLCADENSYLKVCRHIVAGPKSLF